MPSSVAPRARHPSLADPARLAALHGSRLLGAGADPSLDRWTRLAAGLIDAPMALVSLVEGDRQSFASQSGLPESLAAEGGTPLSHSICQHVVASRETLVIADARQHPLVHDNGAVTDLGITAYAGHPVSAGGQTIGSFCVLDTVVRPWSRRELLLLDDLAAGLQAELDLRAAVRDAERLEAVLQHQARHDALTHLANRRQLQDDLAGALASGTDQILAVFDLDGFKAYNDVFGHPAGDALLVRLAGRLTAAVAGTGTAYRLGGDEFCILASEPATIQRAVAALFEQGENFSVASSSGEVRLPTEARDAEHALQLADARMYGQKSTRSSAARRQAHDVLLEAMREREPDLDDHVRRVAGLARGVGTRLGMTAGALDLVERAARMHDVGKIAIPDSIIHKPGPLDDHEWAFMRTHTLVGERILHAAPSLAGVARIVRSTHERWDGAGYPDGLAGARIPLAARIVFVCDAFHAMTSDRVYRPAMSATRALAELRAGAGRQFDPAVVGAFAEHLAAEAGRTDLLALAA